VHVGDQVVDDAPTLVAAHRVLRVAHRDAGQVVGQALVEEFERAGAAHRPLAEMAHVEDADPLAHCRVLRQDAAPGIFDRHLPAAEVGHLCAERDVPVVHGRVLQVGAHG
jgi:hypothetical protein